MIALAALLNATGFLCLAMTDPRYRPMVLGTARGWFATAAARRAAPLPLAASPIVIWSTMGAGPALIWFAALSTIGAALTVVAVTLAREARQRLPTARQGAVPGTTERLSRCCQSNANRSVSDAPVVGGAGA